MAKKQNVQQYGSPTDEKTWKSSGTSNLSPPLYHAPHQTQLPSLAQKIIQMAKGLRKSKKNIHYQKSTQEKTWKTTQTSNPSPPLYHAPQQTELVALAQKIIEMANEKKVQQVKKLRFLKSKMKQIHSRFYKKNGPPVYGPQAPIHTQTTVNNFVHNQHHHDVPQKSQLVELAKKIIQRARYQRKIYALNKYLKKLNVHRFNEPNYNEPNKSKLPKLFREKDYKDPEERPYLTGYSTYDHKFKPSKHRFTKLKNIGLFDELFHRFIKSKQMIRPLNEYGLKEKPVYESYPMQKDVSIPFVPPTPKWTSLGVPQNPFLDGYSIFKQKHYLGGVAPDLAQQNIDWNQQFYAKQAERDALRTAL